MAGVRGRKTVVACAGVLLALLASSLTTPAQADPVVKKNGVAVECPEAMPVGDVTEGMIGEGLTVVRGSTPQAFEVEVLGVLTGALQGGRDLIIINATDIPAVTSSTRVGASGLACPAPRSTSTASCSDRCRRASATAPSTIGGVTPAADMLPLLDLQRDARR